MKWIAIALCAMFGACATAPKHRPVRHHHRSHVRTQDDAAMRVLIKSLRE